VVAGGDHRAWQQYAIGSPAQAANNVSQSLIQDTAERGVV